MGLLCEIIGISLALEAGTGRARHDKNRPVSIMTNLFSDLRRAAPGYAAPDRENGSFPQLAGFIPRDCAPRIPLWSDPKRKSDETESGSA